MGLTKSSVGVGAVDSGLEIKALFSMRLRGLISIPATGRGKP